MKFTKIILIIFIVFLFLLGYNHFDFISNIINNALGISRSERAVLEVLKSDYMNFLVTKRTTSLVMNEISEKNPFLGHREGFLIANVRFYFGLNLENITEDSLQWQNNNLIVYIPEPEILDIATDLQSFRFFSRRSGTMVIRDLITQRNIEKELISKLNEAAKMQAFEIGLVPDKEKMLDHLNALAPLLSSHLKINSILFK